MRVVVTQGENTRFKNFPQDFEGWKDIETGRPVNNISKTDEAYWNSQGIYRVVEPTIDPSTQKKGAGYLDGNVYTFQVELKTQAEQDAYQEQLLNSDAAQTLEYTLEADGKEFFAKFRARMRRLWKDGSMTYAQFKTIREAMNPILSKLVWGDWDIVKDELEALSIPSGAPAIYTTIKNKAIELVDEYIQQIPV